MDGLPTTKYARNGSTHLAYQVAVLGFAEGVPGTWRLFTAEV